MISSSIRASLAVSIKWSLLAAVVFLLAILAGVSITAQLRLTTLERTIDVVGRQRLPEVRALGEIELAITRIRLSAVRLALSASEDQRREAQTLLGRRIEALDQRLAERQKAVAADPGASLLFGQFVAKWKAYLALQARLADPAIAGDRDALGRMINIDTFAVFNEVVAAIDDDIKLANLSADEAVRSAESERATFSLALLAVNGLSALIGLATLLFVVREVSLPIRRMTQTMERIAEGELETEIPYADRGNELGLMARALAVFRKSLVENERLSAATRTLSELSEWLQSAKSETELYGMISDVLARLMPECKGTLYVYAQSRDALEAVTEWNGERASARMHPDDCWCLRRGHPYVHGVHAIEFRCAHVALEASEDYCCIPILAHGETVGMLHLEYVYAGPESLEERKARFADRHRLGLACAEHISIAIANTKLRDELRDQSARDVLTGLNNRRHFLEAGRREIARAAEAGEPMAALALDVDHFKRFNDEHGHDAGDAVLRAVGESLRTLFRGADAPCRVGGEEFIVLLPGADAASALARAEALRATIEGLVVRHGEGELPRVTVSIGVAAFPASGESLAEVAKAADEALYAAKRNGRNRVEAAGAARARAQKQTSTPAVELASGAGADQADALQEAA